MTTNNDDIDDDNNHCIDGNNGDIDDHDIDDHVEDDDDLSVAADSGLMQRGVEGGESEAREEQVDLRSGYYGKNQDQDMITWINIRR